MFCLLNAPAFALGIVGAVDTAGWVIGPLYGALMVALFQWRWIFFINIPFSMVLGAGLWPPARSLKIAVPALFVRPYEVGAQN